MAVDMIGTLRDKYPRYGAGMWELLHIAVLLVIKSPLDH